MIRGAVVVTIVLVLAGCAGDVEPRIVAGVDGCGECGMVIDTPNQACGFVVDGAFVPFDSPACLLRNHDALRRSGRGAPAEVYFADYRDGSFHPAEAVTFVLTEHVPTVMNGGVLCYADRAAAEATLQHPDEAVTDWDGFRLAKGTPDREIAVRIGPGGMEPEVVESDKGELVRWSAVAHDTDGDVVVTIRGYPEVGEIMLPASGDAVEFRMRATRPGTGFSVMVAGSDEPVGRLKVLGAHTADEEAP